MNVLKFSNGGGGGGGVIFRDKQGEDEYQTCFTIITINQVTYYTGDEMEFCMYSAVMNKYWFVSWTDVYTRRS